MRYILIMTTALTLSSTALAQTVHNRENISSDEVIVTAERQVQKRQDYPASIDVLSSDRIEKLAPVHLAEALNTISGVHIHRGSGLEHLTSIRSPVLTGGAGAGSFLYLQDGIPLRAAGFANVNGLFEAQTEFSDRVEVFKGPGSVLYGSNALHGLVNVTSRTPDNINRYHILGSEDGYLSMAASHSGEDYGITMAVSHDDGFRADSGYDQQKIGLRKDLDLGDWGLTWQASFHNLNQETAGFIRGEDAYLDDDIRFTNPNPEAYRDSKSIRSHLKLSKEVGGDQSLVIMPYARWTDMEFLRHFVPGQATEKVGHWSVGALNSYYGKNFILGLDAEFTNGFLDEFQDGPSRFSFVQGAHYDYEVEAITVAGYGEYGLTLGENTELSFGARAEYVDYAYNNKIDTVDVGRFRRVDDRSDNFFVITPKIALSHQLSDGLSLYARAVRGARSPQVADLYSLQIQQNPGEIKSETLDSFEAGLKYGGRSVSLEAAAYVMEKDNFFFRNSAGLNITNGKTSHRGLEVTGRWQATDWLEFFGNVSLADHSYNFSDMASSPSNTIVDGAKVDTAPEIIGTGVIKIMPFDGVSTEIEWRHLGEYFLDPGNTQTYPGHDVFVLRGESEFSSAAILFARIDNLFDKAYANRADFAFGAERYFPGRPRTLFVGIRGEF